MGNEGERMSFSANHKQIDEILKYSCRREFMATENVPVSVLTKKDLTPPIFKINNRECNTVLSRLIIQF